MFSKACEYGIRAVIYIATESLQSRRVKIGDVAENTGSPEAFTAKILGLLTRHRIVNSLKGPHGGFEISLSRMKTLSLSEIVFAIDGDSIYNGCALGLRECNADDPCPMHEKFVRVRSDLKIMLQTTTVHDLATKLLAGESTLIR